jgi:16S rRNA (guanine(966)-N(2))-methyltransferase RsmD
MRIISGEFRRRVLHTPPDATITRPIPDRVKESLFALLRGHFENAEVLDCFAGTGAIGLEALSRGARRVVFVEQSRQVAGILQKNVDMLGVSRRSEVVIGDALGIGALARAGRPLNLAFLDPPYPLMEDPLMFKRVMGQLSAVIDLLAPDGYAVLRTPWPLRHSTEVPGTPGLAEVESAPEPVDPSPRRRKGRREDWKRELRKDGFELGREDSSQRRRTPVNVDPDEGWEPGDPVDDELWLRANAEYEEARKAEKVAADHAARVQRHDADLTLPNARGPETHDYRTMAVHLYMKRPSQAAGESLSTAGV